MSADIFDIAVIGGGINGCGIARDAAGRGARVLLFEANDLASGTSSASTKLIHGGLRYLEHYEFGLVREALSERERLWAIAPHIVRPMRFVLPHVAGLRPRWLIRLGLFLYDHIGGRARLPATETIDLRKHVAGRALQDGFAAGFVYSDCWVDDARLVLLNARDAADRGAEIRTGCRVTRFERQGDHWTVDTPAGQFRARAIVNAAGPAAVDVSGLGDAPVGKRVRLVRGSHIVVPALFAHDYSYFFQLPDGRIFFAIPYEGDFTLIGTTDRDHDGDLSDIRASDEEVAYLCEGASRFFRKSVSPADVVWTYSGVRPLVDDGSDRPEAATRGYNLDLSPEGDGPALLTIFGGKITTYRRLAEDALDLLTPRVPAITRTRWTGDAPLPGGDFAIDGFADLVRSLRATFPFLEAHWAERLARSYGTRTYGILAGASRLDECGRHYGFGLTDREIGYLVEQEWCKTADDLLWRRTKLGLHLDAAAQQALAEAFDERKCA
ncbi:glycerol-3-phosphate dehydrogenase [Sphingopyxis sp. XHP0097]|uniref:Glycerol-3-phosphate dehydrogenase n=1 Tax=Sphingopyxis jiangsuensis TaxID=2871171 RepID=A0ABS7MAH8_9SPHN|nr:MULTISPECIES: glycerol-3-phosphate dehydrogenase [Sphingopyxis]MBY4636023.1 glycerol-3-phosphate dehydrogenase [Sphingopyxis jiangsuensis]